MVEDFSNTTNVTAEENGVIVDKTILTSIVTTDIGVKHDEPAYILSINDYTKETWDAYVDALSLAVTIELDKNSSSKEVEEVIKLINDTKANLKKDFMRVIKPVLVVLIAVITVFVVVTMAYLIIVNSNKNTANKRIKVIQKKSSSLSRTFDFAGLEKSLEEEIKNTQNESTKNSLKSFLYSTEIYSGMHSTSVAEKYPDSKTPGYSDIIKGLTNFDNEIKNSSSSIQKTKATISLVTFYIDMWSAYLPFSETIFKNGFFAKEYTKNLEKSKERKIPEEVAVGFTLIDALEYGRTQNENKVSLLLEAFMLSKYVANYDKFLVGNPKKEVLDKIEKLYASYNSIKTDQFWVDAERANSYGSFEYLLLDDAFVADILIRNGRGSLTNPEVDAKYKVAIDHVLKRLSIAPSETWMMMHKDIDTMYYALSLGERYPAEKLSEIKTLLDPVIANKKLEKDQNYFGFILALKTQPEHPNHVTRELMVLGEMIPTVGAYLESLGWPANIAIPNELFKIH